MLNEETLNHIKKLAQEVSQREGCNLYDLEFIGQGRGRTLRVYIDTPKNDVSIDQCANVSRGLGLLLDVDDMVPGSAYALEVSSPGLERLLKEPWHFEAAVGKEVSVKTSSPISAPEGSKAGSNRKQIKGLLKEVKGDVLIISCNQEDWEVPIDIITKGKLIFNFNENKNTKNINGQKKR